jgi:hypothetical protein
MSIQPDIFDCLKIEVTNHDDEAIHLHCRLDSLGLEAGSQPIRYHQSFFIAGLSKDEFYV